jgi:hypothetical protein
MTPRLPLVLGATALLVSAALAGCSTGGSPGASPASSGSLSAANGSASPAPAAHGAFKIPTTCLSASEVSGLLGLPEHGPIMNAGTDSLICEYLTPTEDGAIINYQTKPGVSPAELAEDLKNNPPADATVTPIAHLGDAAYEVDAAGGTGILLVTGDTVIDIAGGKTSIERVEALALDVLAG